MWALLERKGVNEQGGKLAPQVGVAAAAMSNAGVWALHKVSGRSGPCQVTMQLIAHWSAASTATDLPLLLETWHPCMAHVRNCGLFRQVSHLLGASIQAPAVWQVLAARPVAHTRAAPGWILWQRERRVTQASSPIRGTCTRTPRVANKSKVWVPAMATVFPANCSRAAAAVATWTGQH